jgi:hypothetical protein
MREIISGRGAGVIHLFSAVGNFVAAASRFAGWLGCDYLGKE